MSTKYNQLKAMLAITKASLKATFRSPQSIFFSLFFPIVLIWIFGSLSGGGGAPSVDVAFEKTTDTTNILYQKLRSDPSLHQPSDRKKDLEDELRKGRITAMIGIQPKADNPTGPSSFQIKLRTSSASQRELSTLYALLKKDIADLDAGIYPDRPSIASISQPTMVQGREYKMIDFFLPGMIGFSLIGAAVFGVAFSFYSMRETLVLKRMIPPLSAVSISSWARVCPR
jgi:ABC-2 type transport system permease protein